MNKDNRHIAWVVHPRSIQDVEKGMPLLRKLPDLIKIVMLLLIKPYKVSNFNENGVSRGFVIGVPLLPIHFYKLKKLSTYRIAQAFKLAKKMGVEKVSVGGMITTLAEKSQLGKKYGLDVFDGTTLLAQVATDKVLTILNNGNIKSVGIIGATTKAGSQLSAYLAKEKIDELHLFAKTEKNIIRLAEQCRKDSDVKIFEHLDLEAIGKCDICILTALIPEARMDVVNNLKKGSFFLSIIEPISPFVYDIEKLRPDVVLTKGVSIQAPALSYSGLDFVISSGNAFSCLAEALVADTEQGMTTDPHIVKNTLKNSNLKIS